MKLNSLTEIPDYDYEGYVWMSDEKEPKVLKNKKFTFNEDQQNPFIVEGLLWAKKEGVSIHIRHTGRYLINLVELDKVPHIEESEEVQYLAHRVIGVKNLKFMQLWEPEKDPLCEGMEVLKMKALVFIGFAS